jgi:uncharacterized tellurite resistance protein B-like protein
VGQGEPRPPFNAAERYAGVLVRLAAADGAVSHREALEVTRALSRASLFQGLRDAQLQEMMRRLGAAARSQGPLRLLEACAPGVPPDLRPGAFAWAADIAYSDGRVSKEEVEYLERTARALGLPDAVTAKILVARLRHTE